jgi:hypothetical protein
MLKDKFAFYFPAGEVREVAHPAVSRDIAARYLKRRYNDPRCGQLSPG